MRFILTASWIAGTNRKPPKPLARGFFDRKGKSTASPAFNRSQQQGNLQPEMQRDNVVRTERLVERQEEAGIAIPRPNDLELAGRRRQQRPPGRELPSAVLGSVVERISNPGAGSSTSFQPPKDTQQGPGGKEVHKQARTSKFKQQRMPPKP